MFASHQPPTPHTWHYQVDSSRQNFNCITETMPARTEMENLIKLGAITELLWSPVEPQTVSQHFI